jgi:hypothetical protein
MICKKSKIHGYVKIIVMSLCLCVLCTLTDFQQLNAQVSGTQTHQIKWLSTGALRSWFSNMGAEIEYGRRDRQTYLAVDQIDGLCWPNEFNVRMKGVRVGKSLWIGTTNFADPVSNSTYPYKVICIGGRRAISGTEVFADELSLIGKFPHPNVYVDNARASARDYDDIVDKEDNTLVTDRLLENRFHTSIGISCTRKILSFSQQYNNNYYIYEYTFKNTGIIDESGQQKLHAPLTGVIFYMQSRLALPGVSYNGIGLNGAGGWFPATTSWGRNTITDVMRKDGNTPGEFRANISYWGPMSTTPYGGAAGDIGLPGPSVANVIVLAGYQFVGTVALHADKSPTDQTDDITQPTTTMVTGADDAINGQPSQYNADLMTRKYTTFMAAGHPAQTQADIVGKDGNGWPTGSGNLYGTDAGGYMATQGYGPYTLNPGDSVRIVIAEAVAGINWNKACEVAKNWFTNNASAYVLPQGYKNGATTTDRNEYKNSWVFSGKDSLLQTFRRALAAYTNNFAVPQPPPPPDKFEVNSGGDRIKIKWSTSAESSPHFAGYKLYRSEGKTDTTYNLIFECGPGVTSYDDQNAVRGFNYYYYIQSKDDGTTNPGDPALNIPAGEPLVSSRYYTMTNNPAYLTRPAGAALTVISNTAIFQGNDTTKDFLLPVSIADSTGTIVNGLSVTVDGIKQIPSSYSIIVNTARVAVAGVLRPDTLRFVKAPYGSIEVQLLSPTGGRSYSLSEIRVVPNPWNVKSRNIQFGSTDLTTADRLGFYNLPPSCQIKIYTELGDLITTIDHNNGSGDDYWHSLTSSKQVVVSGLYIAYFEVTEDAFNAQGNQIYRKGDNIFKKFVIIR